MFVNYADYTDDAVEWEFVEEVLCSAHSDKTYIWGPKGIGKSYSAMRVGLNGRPLYSLTMTSETVSAEFRGHWMPKGGEFIWQDGPFIRAMREGARVVIDEISHASQDVLEILYAVLESKETASLTLPNLETVAPAPGFEVIATDNMPKDELPGPLADRFRTTLFINRPHPNALERLNPDLRKLAESTMDIHDDDRGVSIRSWLAVQDLETELGEEKAFKAVFGPVQGRRLREALVMARSA